MRVTGAGLDGLSLFSPCKAPSPTFFSNSPKYDRLPSSNGEAHAKTYIQKFENYPSSNSTYTSSSPERPLRSYSPSKYESLPIAATTSPKLASKFPRYFGSGRRLDLASPSSGNASVDSPKNYSLSSLNSFTNEPSQTCSYNGSYGLPLSYNANSDSPDPPPRNTSYSRYCSLPPVSKVEEAGRSCSPLFTSLSSRLDGGSPRTLISPANSYDSTSSSSFLKLARLNLTPVKFRAKKLTALGRFITFTIS